MIEHLIDHDRFPLNDLNSRQDRALVIRCQEKLAGLSSWNCQTRYTQTLCRQDEPRLNSEAFIHRTTNNIYFDNGITDIPPEHPAQKPVETINRTICVDQIPESLVCRIYEWSPLAEIPALAFGKYAFI